MTETGRYVHIDIVFECPNGHEITRSITHLESPGGRQVLEQQAFEMLECPQCEWKGTKRGSEAKSINVR